mmetsp:Transcript_12122/g.36554  ORF Transcript_12122/g.36554 Transcript_12122/m.36554 type:complete len:290 (+) Transcript_12122:234-1103(+)
MKTLTPELENTSTPDWNVQTRPIHGTSPTPDSLRNRLLRGATDILQSLKSTGSTCGILHYILEKIRMGSDVDQKIHAKQIERHINRKMRIGSLNNIHQYANTLQQHFETYHQANGMIVSDDMKHLMDHKYWEIIKFIIDEAEESQIDFSSLDKLTTHFLRLLCSLGTLLDSEDNTFDKELKIRKSDITNLSDISNLMNNSELQNKILYYQANLKLVEKFRASAFVTGCHPDDIDAEPPESASPPSASPPAPAEDAKAEEPTDEMIESQTFYGIFLYHVSTTPFSINLKP